MAAFTCSLSADAPCLRQEKRVIIIIIAISYSLPYAGMHALHMAYASALLWQSYDINKTGHSDSGKRPQISLSHFLRRSDCLCWNPKLLL